MISERRAGQPEGGQHELGRSQREIAARVVVIGDCVVEAGQLGPAVVVLRPTLRGVDQVEDLFVIAHLLGEFALVVAERVATIATDRVLDVERALEELAGGGERPGDHVVEAVTGEQEEAVVATCPIEVGERRGGGVADVDDGNEIHRRTLRQRHDRFRCGPATTAKRSWPHDRPDQVSDTPP